MMAELSPLRSPVRSIALSIGASLLVTAAVLLACAPWGLSQLATLVPLMLVTALVAALSSGPGTVVPYAVLFVLGLIADTTTAGPLGFSSLVLLMGRAVTTNVLSLVPASSWTVRLLACLGTIIVCIATAWGLTALYLGQTVETAPFLFAGVLAAALVPLGMGMRDALAVLASAGDGVGDRPRSRRPVPHGKGA